MTKFQIEQTQQSVLYMCRLAFKSLALLIGVGYAILYLFLHVPSAKAATLVPEAQVNDRVVRLSDLFDDLPKGHDAVLGASPLPGKTMIINANTLKRVANLYDLDWQPESAMEQVVVTRTSQNISSDQITDALKAALITKGVTGEFELTVGNVIPSLTLAGDLPATVEIANMTYTPGRDVFTAVVAAPSADNPVKTLSLSGVIEKVQNVPVLRSALKAGDIIGAADIEWIPVTAKSVVYDTISDPDRMIGKTPLRQVQAGEPIRQRDLISPQLVQRGDEILIQFSSGAIQLTAKGKAMQPGAEGDLIRVVNLGSNQSLRAEIVGDKIVRVQ
ncbi:MAG: flagellar basal body P-ring formation protein FlgA [Alphaproteobacteria bacterium]|jgi:flagella basal body P-ring formation protein FlgA|nr:flagellar basal body P-ring formation protein FlgA [Alphaproteobacteria bacterium]MCB1550767.1 flagellar basal body P-ring formation protein FlgA [Alphaproteobacteria bacterium]MCB9984392.1 flagellar basal body P-ring formation protein FlgA [Micavibrio sp.]HRK97842.1 flagellar basal body P-ring formation chaperone FlgA [Alphaproteobacteria bacterium]